MNARGWSRLLRGVRTYVKKSVPSAKGTGSISAALMLRGSIKMPQRNDLGAFTCFSI